MTFIGAFCCRGIVLSRMWGVDAATPMDAAKMIGYDQIGEVTLLTSWSVALYAFGCVLLFIRCFELWMLDHQLGEAVHMLLSMIWGFTLEAI